MSSNMSNNISSEDAVSNTIAKGVVEQLPLHVGTGLLVGGIASIVIARGGARKAITGFGGGVGLGAAWTKTSMELEAIFKNS